MEKYIKDGKVAVLYSPGYGAGWSTEEDGELAEQLIFDPEIVKIVLDRGDEWEKTIIELCKKKYPKFYRGGVYRLEVEWLNLGQEFKIDEYDGFESIILKEEVVFYKA